MKFLKRLVSTNFPVWITLPDFPSHLWESEVFGRVGSILGWPPMMDVATTRGDGYDAKILVWMEASGNFPNEVIIVIQDGDDSSLLCRSTA